MCTCGTGYRAKDGWRTLAIYMGEPQRVAAIMLFWRCRAKPKSAVEREATALGIIFRRQGVSPHVREHGGGLTKNTASVPILGREPGEFAPDSESPERQEITDRETKTQTIQT